MTDLTKAERVILKRALGKLYSSVSDLTRDKDRTDTELSAATIDVLNADMRAIQDLHYKLLSDTGSMFDHDQYARQK